MNRQLPIPTLPPATGEIYASTDPRVKLSPLPAPVKRRRKPKTRLLPEYDHKARTELFMRDVAREDAERGPVFASTNPYTVLADSRNVVPIARATPSERSYLLSERRWAPYLARNSHQSGRDVLDLVKARRARLRRASDAYVHGSHRHRKVATRSTN